MKKVIIHAYTQFNLGDDLFVKILCERYPDTTFILPAPKQYKKSFKDLSNLRIFSSDSLFIRGVNYVCRKFKFYHQMIQFLVRNYDATILIGGSLFIQNDHWQKTLEYRKALSVKEKPFFLLGANFGPFHERSFYLEYKNLFKRYTDICFRDQYSYDLFRDLPHVRVASDIVFQLSKHQVKHHEKLMIISVIKPSIRKHLVDKDAMYYQKIKEITIYFMKKGYTVTLISFCESEGDHDAIDAIANLIPDNYLTKLKKHYYKDNLEETLEVISQSNFIVATRFHAMILGWVYEKPVFPISYSKKMEHVMNDIDFNGPYTDFNQLDELDPAQVFASIENTININPQIKDAEKHFTMLDAYLLSDKKE